MTSGSTDEFQHYVLNKLTFSPHPLKDCILYKNDAHPDLGYFLKYHRPGLYEFCVGDYTIPSDFSLSFDHTDKVLRFGTVYLGKAVVTLKELNEASFTPASFFVVEKNIAGTQTWHKNAHYHGAEFIIYPKYLNEVILPIFPDFPGLDCFTCNQPYRYLPLEIASITSHLRNLADAGMLTPLYLESKVMECIALLIQEISRSKENAFTNQLDHGTIRLGKHRFVSLTASDAHAISKAHDILTQNPCNPPTVRALSQMVLLNEQKLKAGFAAKYHMPVSKYTTSLKMAMAQNLLSTTDLSIEEISERLGYNHSGNFIKAFKRFYKETPLRFRRGR